MESVGSQSPSKFTRAMSDLGLGHMRDRFSQSLKQEEDDDLGIPSHWPTWRKKSARILRSLMLEMVVCLVIIINCFTIIVETDIIGRCRTDNLDNFACKDRYPLWLPTLDTLILCFYFVEVGSRIWVDRLDALSNLSTMFDLALVIMGILFEVLNSASNMNLLRIIRLARLGRGIKLIHGIPELYIMVLGLWGCLKTLFWGCLLCVMLLSVWGIVAVDFLLPLVLELRAQEEGSETEFLLESYSSVSSAMLTMFQTIVAGDSWGTYALPLIRFKPWTLLIFMSAFVTIAIGLLNLVTAVVLESATSQPRSKKQKEERRAKAKLVRLCRIMDADKSGYISKQELTEGIEQIEELRKVLAQLNVDATDVDCVFEVLDNDFSGQVSYNEFVEQLHKMKQQDPKTMLQFIKHYVVDIQKNVVKELSEQIARSGQIQDQSRRELLERLTTGLSKASEPFYVETFDGEEIDPQGKNTTDVELAKADVIEKKMVAEEQGLQDQFLEPIVTTRGTLKKDGTPIGASTWSNCAAPQSLEIRPSSDLGLMLAKADLPCISHFELPPVVKTPNNVDRNGETDMKSSIDADNTKQE